MPRGRGTYSAKQRVQPKLAWTRSAESLTVKKPASEPWAIEINFKIRSHENRTHFPCNSKTA